ncbi:MAG: hypothetical protein MN733_04425 [Nitrososphaera sp.]|nr:hypothetical protein [Nitrososphaera sp.]
MKLKFNATTDEGPVAFEGEMSPEEVNALLEFAVVELLRRGYMPVELDRAIRIPVRDPELPPSVQ